MLTRIPPFKEHALSTRQRERESDKKRKKTEEVIRKRREKAPREREREKATENDRRSTARKIGGGKVKRKRVTGKGRAETDRG